jgi:single-stranded DNA-binding protein
MSRNEEKSINTLTLSGMLQGVIVRNTSKGDAVSNGTLVLVDGFRGNGSAKQQFVRLVAWRGLATKAAELANHSKVRITGRLETESWVDKETGVRKYRQVIVAHSLAPISDLREVPPENEKESSKRGSGSESARAILAPPLSPEYTPKTG